MMTDTYTIKPLEWRYNPAENEHEAATTFGRFYVAYHNGFFRARFELGPAREIIGAGFVTEDEAKANCQKIWDATIKQALVKA